MKSTNLLPLLKDADAARLLGVSVAWLQRKRWEKAGPAYIRHGRAVRYEPAAIAAWIDAHRQHALTGEAR